MQFPRKMPSRLSSTFSSLFHGCGTAALMLVSCSEGGDIPASTGGATTVDASTGGAMAMGSGGADSTGGQSASGGLTSTGGAAMGTGGDEQATGGAPPVDLKSFAAGLNEVLIDRPCGGGTNLPLGNGAVCPVVGDLHAETKITFGGDSGTDYLVTLRVRGIWEPTKIVGGTSPISDVPLMVGGQVEPGAGDSAAMNYQQFYLQVASPMETYWFNNHGYVAHDIHKEDYEMTLLVEGGSEVTIIANDGNDRQIANFPQESFPDLPPYDQTPTLGQFMRLDVINVELAP